MGALDLLFCRLQWYYALKLLIPTSINHNSKILCLGSNWLPADYLFYLYSLLVFYSVLVSLGQTYPNPLQDNPAYSAVRQYFVDYDDTVQQKVALVSLEED